MKISVVIILKNEEKVIGDCLESVKWADEIILIDGGSTDKTLDIVKKYKVRVVEQKVAGLSFAAWHNQGKEEAKYEWLLYVDADERITPLLKEEINEVMKENDPRAAYAIPRRNFLLGKELRFGGWAPDYQKRLFVKKNLKRWTGVLHEQPEINGEVGKLQNPMIHFQPEKLEPALEQSIKWSILESGPIVKSGHPKISWWRVLRMGVTTFWERMIVKQGFRDGGEGFIESIYQVFHTMIIYLRVWEKQQKETG